MRTDSKNPVVRLAQYTPPPWLIDTVALTFRLSPDATAVHARISFRPNPEHAGDEPRDLVLDGEGLTPFAAKVDDRELPEGALKSDETGLRVSAEYLPQQGFEWSLDTVLAPADNTSLDGLYLSHGMYCTQCEAQGFRKITYFPDRPDVMATYTVRIESDAPVLLSNGNQISQGPGWVEWHDPHRKPSYLFALVAGDLRAVEDKFVTMNGRDVLLQIWVRPGDEDRCGYAMDALKRSMTWDEQEYGREYDLDRFMIVAVDDFNMGAMENKGLNIFNSKYVLASPETATDSDYKFIEAIIAHEYFHNWTGNRITCRDWFQLCLKEGLTVYRDQQFSGDMRSHGVKRIEDVIGLRAQQFTEDAGPLSHPVRPAEYIEINNFYTATVYEKGAEVIGMLRALVGPETYRKALDLYFERHDGQACTIEDWLKVFEDTSGRDLAQFALWYSQAGTPRIAVGESWDGTRYQLTLEQTTAPTPGQAEKSPLLIPVAYGLLGKNGEEIATGTLELDDTRQNFAWDLAERPVASVLRGFSAPVILDRPDDAEKRIFRLTHDNDPFNRWEAGREHALDLLRRMVAEPGAMPEPEYLAAVCAVADDPAPDPAYKALLLGLPQTDEIIASLADAGQVPDPVAVHVARLHLVRSVATALGPRAREIYEKCRVAGPYSPDAGASGLRSLRARMLSFMSSLDPQLTDATTAFDTADNMTESMSALGVLVAHGGAEQALAAFHERWKHDRLVTDKWFAVQAAATPPELALETVRALADHSDFDWRNPNRLRSLVGAFAMSNPVGFHSADGTGYRFLTDWLIRLDPVNPQTTARLVSAFGNWRIFDAGRQALMKEQLNRLAALPGLSKDTSEMVGRLLAPATERTG